MDLDYLQERVREYGDKTRAQSEKLGVQIPNHYAFPFIKLVEEVGEVADLLEDKYGIRKDVSEKEFRERMRGIK